MSLGQRLNELMREKKISQYKLSRALNVSDSTVANWRNDAVVPEGDNLIHLAEFFGTSVEYLRGKAEQPSAASASTGDVKIDILARAARKMTEEEKDKLIEMAKVLFRKAFDEKDR